MKSKLFVAAIALMVTLSSAFATKPGWSVNYKDSLAKAAEEEKYVLLDFTGSDWCGWCVKLDEELFSKKSFKTFASENLVLVELDYPQDIKQPESVVKQNEKLAAKYKVESYPTIILVDSEGVEQKRWEGYDENMFDEIKKFMAE